MKSKRLNHALIGAAFAVAPLMAMATNEASLPTLLRLMPEQVCNELLLTRTNLLDLIDTYEAHATTPIRNRLNELVRLDTLTTERCSLQVASSTTAAISLAPNGEQIEMVLTTTLNGVPISSTRLYTLGWEDLGTPAPTLAHKHSNGLHT